MGSLRECFVALPNRQVTFIIKTDGVRIWGALKNFSAEPQHLMPRYDLLACRTSVQWCRVPDKGIVLIPEGHKGSGFCQIAGESSGGNIPPTVLLPTWVDALKSKYAGVFKVGLGTCRTYIVHKFPFHFPLPWKSQSRSPMTGPAEEVRF